MNFSLQDKAMASQVKKNKNQFIRKATASLSVNKTIQDVSNVDVSAIQSGVESIQIDTPNVNTGQINVHLTNTQTCTEGVKPIAGYEQPTSTEAGNRSWKPEENFDPGGTMHAPTTYNQYSDYVPKLHSDSHFKPSIGSSSQSAIMISASGNFSENQAEENPRTLEDLPFMTGAAQRSRHSEAPGHPDGSHTDTHVSHLVHQHVPGSRHFEPHGHPDESHTDTYVSQLRYQHMLNQGNTTPSLGQQTSEGAVYDHVDNNHAPPLPKTQPPELPAKPPRMAKNETWGQHSSPSLNRGANHQRSTALQNDYSSRPQKQGGHQFSNNLDDDREEKEDIPWEYPGERKVIDHHMMASNIQYPNFEEQAQMQYGGDAIRYNNEQGGHHNQSSKAGQMFNGQHGEQTLQLPGWQPGGPMQQMQGGLYKGNVGNTHSHGRDFGYTSSWQKEGNSGQLQDGQHAKGHVGFKTAGQPAGSMGPVPTIHHAGTMGQMPYQQNEESVQQMLGGLHGGAMGKMHPHAQFEAMHPCGQEYMGEFQNVRHQPEDVGQFWDFPPETWQGDGQGHANYSQGASNFPGPSTDMTDRELAAEQFDQRMNNPWFQEMVQNMKELVEREGLIVKDVFPDGNCLFTAVIDQLRVRGNFNFTPSTLRAAAVTFLREHPKQHDGTHLEQFLTNESWDQYLDKMCRDGVWGEHIILGAMSEVLKCRIIVLGGMSGKSRTIVQPQHVYDEEEKDMQNEKEEANGCKTVKDEPLKETAKTEKSEGAQYKSLQTGAASSTSEAGDKTKGTDTSQRKDKISSHSKQDKEKKDEELHIGEDLYIGLLGEMHYVSLRKKDWEERLNEKLRARIRKRKARKKQEAGQEDYSSSDDDLCLPEDSCRTILHDEVFMDPDPCGAILHDEVFVDPVSQIPLPHLSFLFWQLCSSPFTAPPNGHNCRRPGDLTRILRDESGFEVVVMGYWVEFIETLPVLNNVKSRIPFFTKITNHCWCPCDFSYIQPLTVFFSPLDTHVMEDSSAVMNDLDLGMALVDCQPGFTKLSPVNASKWGDRVQIINGRPYLQHLSVHELVAAKTVNNWRDLATGKYACMCEVAFHCTWPKLAEEWITRNRSTEHRWLFPNIKQLVVSGGCHIKAAVFENNPTDKTHWEFCFQLAETYLIQYVVYDKHSRVYRIFKLLAKTQLKELTESLRDILRHVFYYACEKIEPKTFRLKPAVCILYMLSRLIKQLQTGFVPHYFICTRNLIGDLSIDMIERMIQDFQILRDNIIIYAGLVMEERKLLHTGIATVFEKIIEEVNKFSHHKDIQVAKLDIAPLFIQEVMALVRCQKYKLGYEFCSFLRSELITKDSEISLGHLLQQILIGMPVNDRWNFAFYLDGCTESQGFLNSVCRDEPTEPLEILFGPDISEYLGQTLVLKECTSDANVIDFVEKFVNNLKRYAELYPAVISGLKYFLSHSTHRYRFQEKLDPPVVHGEPICTCTYSEEDLQLHEVYSRIYRPNINLQLAGLYQSLYNAYADMSKIAILFLSNSSRSANTNAP